MPSLLHLLRRAGQRADLVFLSKVKADLTPRQFAVLEAVSKEGLSQTGIMASLEIDRSSTSVLVRRLEKSGALLRRRPSGDARTYEVRLTARGRQLLAAGQIADQATGDALLAHISSSQRDLLLDLLQRVASAKARVRLDRRR